MQLALDLDGLGDTRERLTKPEPRCVVCGADGDMPCGWWSEAESREPNGWPLHRVGSPWVHGKRGQAERSARLAAAGIEPWASEARARTAGGPPTDQPPPQGSPRATASPRPTPARHRGDA